MVALGRSLLFVLGGIALVVGLVLSVYFVGIPLAAAGGFVMAKSAGYRGLVPSMVALSLACAVPAAFGWWALLDGETSYWYEAPVMTVASLASAWFAYTRRRGFVPITP